MRILRLSGLILALLSFHFLSQASHIFGGELTYKHISGLTYELTLTLYGDCSGNSFPNLPSSVPQIKIYNGQNAFTNITLQPFGIVGEEVTPVCPSQINNTACKGGPLPGVARFIFKNNVTLNASSANWQFIFDGTLGATNFAGRSNAITNINQATGTSIMQLIATLNNLNGPNNSSTYTTIPTPFFCINTSQQYNQGAIDSDGDNLAFSLVPGLDANNNANVVYVNPYTYSTPLAAAAGSYNFNTGTGQLSFYPNAVQNSLVVSKVTETRNGVVVGTSMREMTFVVLSNCNNQGPGGSISNNTGGTIVNATELNICNGDEQLQFEIHASDPDNQNINASFSGLPQGASVSINNNGTASPVLIFNWNIPAGLTPGDHTFYVTYQDDGCPLSSKQTLAYTIHFVQPVNTNITTLAESCTPSHDGSITVNASGPNGGYTYSFNGGAYGNTNTFGGLNSGVYTIQVKDAKNCTMSSTVFVSAPILPVISNIAVQDIKCFGGHDGSLTVEVQPANPSYVFQLMPGNIVSTNGTFQNLGENTYTVIVDDTRGCKDTATASIAEPDPIVFNEVSVSPVTCNKTNGKIIVKTNFDESTTYKLMPTSFAINTTGYFDNLASGSYTIVARNANNCTIDTVVFVPEVPKDFVSSTTQTDLPCNGSGNEGEAEIHLQGGMPPYTVLWSGEVPQTGTRATGLYYGWYFIEATDATGCDLRDTVYIQPGNCCENIILPSAFSPNYDGKNDEWKMITSTGMEIQEYAIFDRWGQKVWLGRDQRDAWNGKMGNGEAAMGTYFYILRYKCLTDGKTYLKKGDITLVK